MEKKLEKKLMNNTKNVLFVLIVLYFLIMPVTGRLFIKDEEPLVQIRHTTDKLIYRIGEPVNISFENNENKILYFSEITPWEIWKFEFRIFQWQSIIDPLSLQVVNPVLPGGMRNWVWDQKDNKSEQVARGLYRVGIPYSESLFEWELMISHSIFIIV